LTSLSTQKKDKSKVNFKFILHMNKFNNQQKIKQNKYINNFLMKQISYNQHCIGFTFIKLLYHLCCWYQTKIKQCFRPYTRKCGNFNSTFNM